MLWLAAWSPLLFLQLGLPNALPPPPLSSPHLPVWPIVRLVLSGVAAQVEEEEACYCWQRGRRRWNGKCEKAAWVERHVAPRVHVVASVAPHSQHLEASWPLLLRQPMVRLHLIPLDLLQPAIGSTGRAKMRRERAGSRHSTMRKR